MCDFQPGDLLVREYGESHKPISENQVIGDFRFERGRPYVVSDVREHRGAHFGVQFSDAPHPFGDGRFSWDARFFRRVYRPDGSLISKLLEPVDLGEEVR